jgi:prepilin-type N-terminal cleavage/methylation domain-containing protein
MATQKGFTLIELLIVILIVGILAAVATPLYLGYVKDAKTAEAKAVAGSLWTAMQSQAIATCGTAATVQSAFAKAGLSSAGESTPARWTAGGGANTLTVNCANGAYTAGAGGGEGGSGEGSGGGTGLFTVTGTATDVSFVRVRLVYNAGSNPPAKLQCSTDSGSNFSDC